MTIWVGTSGYNYPEWKGSFYPETLPAKKMLPYYAEHFPTVEINYTFYRAPNEKILDGWNQATPERFKLTLKAPKRITHDRRLRDCAEPVRQFLETAATLGPKLGALLFQLPPNLKKDLALFDAFLEAFPPRVCAAFEFRHESWLDEEVYARLRARNLGFRRYPRALIEENKWRASRWGLDGKLIDFGKRKEVPMRELAVLDGTRYGAQVVPYHRVPPLSAHRYSRAVRVVERV